MKYKPNRTKQIVETIIKGTNIILFLLVLNLLAGNFGLYSYTTFRLFAFFILMDIIIINIPLKGILKEIKKRPIKNFISNLYVGFILIIVGFAVLFLSNEKEIGLFGLPIIIFGLDMFLQEINVKRSELFVLFITSLSYSLFILFVYNMPFLWRIIQKTSLSFTEIIGQLSRPLSLGPSASGFWMLLTFIFFSLTLFFFSEVKRENKKKLFLLICSVLGPIVSWTIYLFFLTLYPFGLGTANIINSKYILFFLGVIPVFYLIIKNKTTVKKITISELREIKQKQFTKKWEVAALTLLLIHSGLILTTFPYGSSDKGKIVIYPPGLGGFTVPDYNTYGQHGSGFFGFLPDYLNTFGFDSEISTENITEDTLNDADIFVIISVNKTFTPQEHDLIWNFVENGGALLVIGDHTDMSGIMDPLNSLLEPVDISFRFDSAMPSKEQWVYCYDLMHHPVTEGIEDAQQICVSVGASLDIAGSAFPVIIGKHSFSDLGNHLNAERAYLGDYQYNPGEQLGDLILVAGAHFGKGKVLVFGDMTSFQNPVMPYSYPVVNNVVTWLTNERTANLHYAQVGVSLFLIAGSIFIYRKIRKKVLLILFPTLLCISLITSATINPILLRNEEFVGPIAYIDSSHGEKIDLQPYKAASVDGLIRNLQRNKYLPLIMRDFSEEKILNGEILILIAPTCDFTNEEIQSIKAFMFKGGIVILSTGYPDRTSSIPILKEVGLEITNIPLGPVPYIERETTEAHRLNPKFVDSYPIQSKEENNNSFYKIKIGAEIYTLVAFKQYGTGGLLLISDSSFLLNDNLESLYDYWPGNVIFFRDILIELEERGVLQ